MTHPDPESVAARPALLRARAAAAMLAVSPRKLWELTHCGQIRCIRIGRAVRYDVQDLVHWIDQQRSPTNRRRE